MSSDHRNTVHDSSNDLNIVVMRCRLHSFHQNLDNKQKCLIDKALPVEKREASDLLHSTWGEVE